MSQGENWGCLATGVVVVAGAVWGFNHYEITRKDAVEPAPLTVAQSQTQPERPAGIIHKIEIKGDVWSVDANGVRGDRPHRTYWVTEDHLNAKAGKARSSMILYTVDCDTTAYRSLSVVEYDKAGKVLDRWPESMFTKTVSYPPPDSTMSGIIEAVCDRGFDVPR